MGEPKIQRKQRLEVCERAVRLMVDQARRHLSQWTATSVIAAKIGCSIATLHAWVRQAERDRGLRPRLTGGDRERMKALERENHALPPANESRRKASAYFATGQ